MLLPSESRPTKGSGPTGISGVFGDMSRQYSPKTFLRQVPNSLLKKYFQKSPTQIDLGWDSLGEKLTEAIFEVLEQLSPEDYQTVETEFTMINELACTAGVIKILEWADTTGEDWAGKFEAMNNAYERAFWTFLNNPGIFHAAGNLHEMDRFGSWWRCFVGEQLVPNDEASAVRDFESELSTFYSKQGRGRFCHTDKYLLEPTRQMAFSPLRSES